VTVDSVKLFHPTAATRDPLTAPVRDSASIHRKCPKCSGTRGCVSHPRDKYEIYILPLLLQRPLRCKSCHFRYYGFDLRWTTIKQAVLELGAAAVVAYGFWGLIVGLISLNLKFDFFK
jgi:hypothetical protein